jgi:F0F1-type ATP synthase assembly protein I
MVEDSKQGGGGQPPSPRAYVGLGIEMAVTIVVFMYAGYWLDAWLETAPWLFTVGALLGVTVAFYSFFRRVLPIRNDPSGKAQ